MQTAAVLTARVLQVRRIDLGASVGYAATFRAKRPSMIATVALGAARMRNISDPGAVRLDGRLAARGRAHGAGGIERDPQRGVERAEELGGGKGREDVGVLAIITPATSRVLPGSDERDETRQQ